MLDLTDGYAELAGRLFAELGAEVVHVERPDAEGSLYRDFRSAGKSVYTADADEAERLLAGADIAIVASDGVGSALQPAALAERHPSLIVIAITPFGLTGPAAGWQATELVAQAMAGFVYRSGVAELPPVAAPGRMTEDIGSALGVLAALVALRQRDATGAGQLIDVSAVLAAAQCSDFGLPLWSLLRMHQTRSGAGAYPIFECTDGMARIVLPMSIDDWRRTIEWLGSPAEWTGPEWEGMLGPAQRTEVVERMVARFAHGTRDEIAAEGDRAGLKITPVLTPAEVLDNEHVDARGTFVDVEIAPGETGRMFAGFMSVDGQRAGVADTGTRIEAAPSWPAREPAARTTTTALPLAGIRVLEIGSGVAAPEAGRILAEWGADVIKIESRRHPDFQRLVMGGDMNPAFATTNRSKRSFAVELGTPEGRELVQRLLPDVDVVIENNATGVLDRLGVGWDVISRINPRAVLVGTQLYGDRGPWADKKGYGPSARAIGGLSWLWAHGPDAPRGVQVIHPDHLAGRMCAIGALAGLRHRDATGVGCRIDLAQFEAVAGLIGDLLLAESLTPGAALPVGNASAEHVPWGLYRCAGDETGETWLAVCVETDEQWSALVAASDGGIAETPEWRSAAGRLVDRTAIDAAVGEWLRTCDAAATEQRLQAAGIAAGQALHGRLQSTHPHFVARGYPTPLHQPHSGELIVEGPAFVGSRLGSPRLAPAPLPGEHTWDIAHDLLGLDDDAIARLVGLGALDPIPERA
ncbi:MAG: putative family CoA-transferase [Ilumatobacteraceae bacterium]|nr:putative family CoA-transferase [Ilumatobacteraceae bacterium]